MTLCFSSFPFTSSCSLDRKNLSASLLIDCNSQSNIYTHSKKWIQSLQSYIGFDTIDKKNGISLYTVALLVHVLFLIFLLLLMNSHIHPSFKKWYKKSTSAIRHAFFALFYNCKFIIRIVSDCPIF